jgi:NAD/NADP transhydrogenase alpha subunit
MHLLKQTASEARWWNSIFPRSWLPAVAVMQNPSTIHGSKKNVGPGISSQLADIDVIVLSALVPGEVAPILITDKMVAGMKPGSVIIDVSIDQGGNCEVTEPGEFIQKHGVHVCGIQNIPGRMAGSCKSWLYANNLYYYVENLFKKGKDSLDLI